MTQIDVSSLNRGLTGAWCPSVSVGGYGGNLTINDISGYSRRAYIYAGAMNASNICTTEYGRAIRFDGSTTVLSAGYPTIQPRGKSTISVWFSATSFSRNNGLVGALDSGDRYALFLINNDLYLDTLGSIVPDNRLVTSGLTWENNALYHVVGTMGTGMRLYRNGALVASNIGEPVINSATETLIGAVRNSTFVLSGDIYDVRLYNRTLSPLEVKELYEGGPGYGLRQKRRRIRQSPGAGTNDLLANDLQSLSQLSTPTLGQTHGLLANDLQSLSSVSSSALAQGHALLANDLQSLSQLSTPTLGQTHVLLANDLQSTSSVSTPSVGVIRNLLADNLESVSTVSTPAVVSTVDTLLADNLQSVSSLSVPVLRQKKQINYAASATIGSLSAITFYHNSGKWYGY
jgi:hypothetical protein